MGGEVGWAGRLDCVPLTNKQPSPLSTVHYSVVSLFLHITETIINNMQMAFLSFFICALITVAEAHSQMTVPPGDKTQSLMHTQACADAIITTVLSYVSPPSFVPI